MWDKPHEVAAYPGSGYEISVFSPPLSPDGAVVLWSMSTGHEDMILNRNEWRELHWRAMGVAINEEYAVVWFGEEPDWNTVVGSR